MENKSPFLEVTRIAVQELLQLYGQPSRYGLFLTDEGQARVVEGVLDLLATARQGQQSARIQQEAVAQAQQESAPRHKASLPAGRGRVKPSSLLW